MSLVSILRSGCFIFAFAIGVFLFSPTHLAEADFIVPSSAASTEGNNNSVVPFNTASRTNQYQMTNAAMGGIAIGTPIAGVQFRLDGGQAIGPTGAITWPDFEITLAQATNAIGSMVITLANNMTNPVLVMDGTYTLNANSLPGAGTPRSFGVTVMFDTVYTYAGGDLVMLLTHTNSNPTAVATPLLDAIQTDTAGTGGIRALSTVVGFQVATADNMAFRQPVMQFITAVPEARAWMLVGAVAVIAVAVHGRKRLAAA